MAISQLLDPLRAIEKGGKIVWLIENNGGEFVMVAKNEIKDCKGVDGKRFAIHGETATTSLATKNWLIRNCKVNPKILVIPGGENRIVALQNNQIDGTTIQLGDWLNLDSNAPGKFHVLETGGLYNISGAGLFANADWLDKNKEIATAYVAETLKTFRMIHANPMVLDAVIKKYVPDTPKNAIGPAIKAYINVVKAWPQNGGDTTMLDDTIKFFSETGELKPGMDSKRFVNTAVLESALKIVNKVSGAR
jgi:ABC-type nitrate/sulfonate/bicarbonate transport system substrate-binding protein